MSGLFEKELTDVATEFLAETEYTINPNELRARVVAISREYPHWKDSDVFLMAMSALMPCHYEYIVKASLA